VLINVVVEMSKRFAIPLETGIVTGGATVRALAQAVKERIGAGKEEPQIEKTIAVCDSTGNRHCDRRSHGEGAGAGGQGTGRQFRSFFVRTRRAMT
jgi:hypothetical protein